METVEASEVDMPFEADGDNSQTKEGIALDIMLHR